MTDLTGKTCCHNISTAHGWRFYACGKKAKVEHKGKFYCGIHDPVRATEKIVARNAKWDAETKAKQAAWNKAYALKMATAALVEAVRAATEQRGSWDVVSDKMVELRKAETIP
jgi:hypothetical protein